VSSLIVTNEPSGAHNIDSYVSGTRLTLVRVDSVGVLQILMTKPFHMDLIPKMVEALTLAERISGRRRPWEAWTGEDPEVVVVLVEKETPGNGPVPQVLP
jgi:hypothetical protein